MPTTSGINERAKRDLVIIDARRDEDCSARMRRKVLCARHVAHEITLGRFENRGNLILSPSATIIFTDVNVASEINEIVKGK